jgi:hypothetical protein
MRKKEPIIRRRIAVERMTREIIDDYLHPELFSLTNDTGMAQFLTHHEGFKHNDGGLWDAVLTLALAEVMVSTWPNKNDIDVGALKGAVIETHADEIDLRLEDYRARPEEGERDD